MRARDFDQSNPLQRLNRWFASTSIGSWLFARLLQPADELFERLTGGRRSMTAMLAGLPTLTLTTTGARSGRARTVPLIGLRTDGGMAVIASNFGQVHHPAWSHNLHAHPDATMTVYGRAHAVHAVAAEGEQRARIWKQAVALYPGYAVYEKRAAHRDIVVWVLTPAAAGEPVGT